MTQALHIHSSANQVQLSDEMYFNSSFHPHMYLVPLKLGPLYSMLVAEGDHNNLGNRYDVEHPITRIDYPRQKLSRLICYVLLERLLHCHMRSYGILTLLRIYRNTKPLYTPSYHLSHYQCMTAHDLVKDMLRQYHWT